MSTQDTAPELTDDERAEFAALLPPAVPAAGLPRRQARRYQLLRTIAEPERPPRFRVPKPALAAGALVVTVGLSAVGAAVVDRDTDRPAPSQTAPVRSLTELLAGIDDAAERLPDVRAGVGQVVYGQTEVAGSDGRISLRETWTSLDGRTGLLRVDGIPAPVTTYVPQPGDLPDLARATGYPTYETLRAIADVTPRALRAQLRADVVGLTGDPSLAAFRTVRTMLTTAPIPPRLRATLFRAAAELPGIRFVPRDVALGNQPGPALVLAADGAEERMVIDVGAVAVLGDRTHAYEDPDLAGGFGEDGQGRGPAIVPAGPSRPVTARDWRNVTLFVPDTGWALGAAVTARFRDGVAIVEQPGGVRMQYAIGDGQTAQYGDVTGDGLTDVVVSIEQWGYGDQGPPESSYVVVAYAGAEGGRLVPIGVVEYVSPLTTGPTFTIESGVVTVHPRLGGSTEGSPTAYRWNGVWFVPQR
ncbi:hypothetical protein [Cryptosporangium minutisporangium]|uniref:VCBS repeat-containing protein n=1 Tax=Cryptosporangium minutisporangium TaxID=113569 RepID=A0ABP6SYZ2_9ACTN